MVLMANKMRPHRIIWMLPVAVGWVWLVAVLPLSTAWAEEGRSPRPALPIREIQATYEKIRDLSADFIHTVQFGDFESRSSTSGKFVFKRGDGTGKMRWDYETPQRSQIFIDGDVVLHYMPEHQQVIKSRIGTASSLPFRLLSGSGHLDRDFHVVAGDTPNTSFLIPKEKIDGISQIHIQTAPFPPLKGPILEEVTMHEENGNIVTFSFKKIRVNQGLTDDQIRLVLPKGVERIDAP